MGSSLRVGAIFSVVLQFLLFWLQGTVLSDRPPLMPQDSPHPHLPIPESLWAQPPQSDGSYPEPIGASVPAAFMTIPDHILHSEPQFSGWSEWAMVLMIHRALREAVRFLQFCRGHKLDPYAGAAGIEGEKLHMRVAREDATRMFREVLAYLDLVYARLPPWFAMVENDPAVFLDPNNAGTGVPRDKRIEACHLLTYLHTTYAMLFAPKIPDPDLPSTKLWIRHQPVFGVPCAASGPVERHAVAAFPFSMEAPWLAPGTAKLKEGSFCPSPAAMCHFHTDRVTKMLKGLLLFGDEVALRRLPPFVMWCSAQTFFFRFLLASLSYAKVLGSKPGMDHQAAVRRAIRDTEEHMQIMDPMRKRWKAADASARHMRQIMKEAIASGEVRDEVAVFSAVGVIHQTWEKVDRAISYVEEIEE